METYNKTCVTSKDSDQPEHPPSMRRLIWVFAGRTNIILGFVVRWLNFFYT